MNAPDPRPPAGARLAVMLSGSGRTLLNLLDAIKQGLPRGRIVLVIAARGCVGARRARDAGIRVGVSPGDIPASALAPVLTRARIAWVVLAGYLRLIPIPPGFEGRIVNIPPALLP